jgi:hypothetical protein
MKIPPYFSILRSLHPITPRDIAQFETELGYPLPSDYRQFLLVINGGRPKPDCFMSPITGYCSVDDFLGIATTSQRAYLDLIDKHRLFWDFDFLNYLLPIAGDICGNYFCMSLRPRDYGHIYFWDHECDHYDPFFDDNNEPREDIGLELLFHSFSEMWSGWQLNPEMTPFERMVFYRDLEGLKRLIDEMPDVNAPMTSPPEKTMLEYLMYGNYYNSSSIQIPEVIQWLLERGATADVFKLTWAKSVAVAQLMIQQGQKVTQIFERNQTPLMTTIGRDGNFELAQFFVVQGVDVHHRDDEGLLALDYAYQKHATLSEESEYYGPQIQEVERIIAYLKECMQR